MRKKTLALIILAVLVIAIVLGLFLSGNVLFQISGPSQSFVVPCTIATYGNAWEGELAYGLFQTSTANGPIATYLVVMDTNSSLEYLRQSNDPPTYEIAKNIAPGMLMFQGEPFLGGASTAPVLATHFWNYVSNTTQDFLNVTGHHDIEYDPVNNTFLTLQNYVRVINNTRILFDKIVQLSPTGNILWSWDTYDHIPLSDADPFNVTSTLNGTTVVDFTHANALEWDYNNSIIYLNLRHTNAFYKINQTTGDIIWACGEHGNFTLLGADGTPVSSLWYHSHDTKQVEPNVFIMFDNDYDNETNPKNCQSRIIEVTLNEQNMTAWVSWSWTAPKQYWSPYWGSADRLTNGDRIGVFGPATHRFPQNQPWTGNDTGALVIEVDPAGNVVRNYTFPVGWGIYRMQEIIYSNPTPTPSPSPSPTPSQTPTLSPSPTPSATTSPTPSPTVSPTPSPTPPSSNPSNYLKILTYAALLAIAIVIIAVAVFFYLKKNTQKQKG
jgi:hypothetical protein